MRLVEQFVNLVAVVPDEQKLGANPIDVIKQPLVVAAARQLPADRLGTCDDCGFSPFADDTSTSRETAFAKISARVEGTALASQALGL